MDFISICKIVPESQRITIDKGLSVFDVSDMGLYWFLSDSGTSFCFIQILTTTTIKVDSSTDLSLKPSCTPHQPAADPQPASRIMKQPGFYQ